MFDPLFRDLNAKTPVFTYLIFDFVSRTIKLDLILSNVYYINLVGHCFIAPVLLYIEFRRLLALTGIAKY